MLASLSTTARDDNVRRFQAMVAAVGAFAARHPVFRLEELDTALVLVDPEERRRRARGVARLVRRGVLVRIARRTYAVVGDRRDGHAVVGWRPSRVEEAYGAAGRVNGDGVLAYRSALELHGVMAHRPGRGVTVVSQAGWGCVVRWGGVLVRTLDPPKHLRLSGRCGLGVRSMRTGEIDVRVTGPERTFVDALHRPRLVGSWRDILEALARLVRGHAFDWRMVVVYVRRLRCATTASRVGWVLERGRAWNGVPERVLMALERLRAPGPVYWVWHDRRHCEEMGVRFARRWHLLVRREVVEIARDINRGVRQEGQGRRLLDRASA
jgi:predicted transcriptional regulator of viral defense system